MSQWGAAEMAAGQMPDARQGKRLAQRGARLGAKPVRRIPSACHGWSETVAAYRLLDNPAIGIQAILSGHKHATRARRQTQDVVLLGQDTTLLNYGTTQPKAGMGTVQVQKRTEYLLHPTVALPPERVNVGVLGAKWWQRPAQPVAQARTRKPIEEQESARWFEGATLAWEVKQTGPGTLVVNVADRAGDSHEWVGDAIRRPPEARAEFLIRAKCTRRLGKGKEHRALGTAMREAQPLGRLTVALARPPERPPRPLTVTVTAKPGTVHQARRPGGPLPPGAVGAIYAQEGAPPQGEDAVAWLRLPSLPVMDCARACPVRPWDRCRWEMARFVRVLKQGCQIEQLRLQTAQRRLHAIAIYLIMAWRIPLITMAGRAYPEVSWAVVFEPHEWQTMYTMQHRCHPPQTPPVLRDIVRSLAQRGGFFARKGDGEPGMQAIWQGDQRLHAFIYAVDIHRTVHAL